MKKLVVIADNLNIDIGSNPVKYLKDNKDFVLEKYEADVLRVDFDDGTFYVLTKDTKKEPKKFKLYKTDNVSPEDIKKFDTFTRASNHKAPDVIVESRMKTCRECESFIKSENRCKECGCGIKGKVMLSDSFCPLKKWERYQR